MMSQLIFCSFAQGTPVGALGGGFGSRLAPSTWTGQHVDCGQCWGFCGGRIGPSPEVAALLASRGLKVGCPHPDFRHVASASVVFAMTAAHAEAAQRIWEMPRTSIQTLDPAGDVPDPIGHGFGVRRLGGPIGRCS